jgi:hypothetical protein
MRDHAAALTRVRYVPFSRRHDGPVAPFRSAVPPYRLLVPEVSNSDADVTEVE